VHDCAVRPPLDDVDDVASLGLNNSERAVFAAMDSPRRRSIRKKASRLKKIRTSQSLRMSVLESTLPLCLVKDLWEKLSEGSRDETKFTNWVRASLSLPLGEVHAERTATETALVSSRCEEAMNTSVMGNEAVKQSLLRLIRMRDAKRGRGFSVALEGPPGIGKTTLARAAFEALDMPFFSIPLNGAFDAAYLRGSCYVYEGSMPGKIAQCLQAAQTSRVVFFFDEVDKISRSARGDEITPVLMGLTDPAQNDAFQDKYFHGGIEFDLSKCIFVFAYNDRSLVSPILLDRLHVLAMEIPTAASVQVIVERVTVPRICALLRLEKNAITLTDDALREVCAMKERAIGQNVGVRDIERRVEVSISDKCISRMTQDGTWPERVEITLEDVRKARTTTATCGNDDRSAVNSMFS
tara:strand:- start:1443 stop:2672 length:1230 start_codon:yes stop_codon:yes gene_type:complete